MIGKTIYELEEENELIDEILEEIEFEESRAYSKRNKGKGEGI